MIFRPMRHLPVEHSARSGTITLRQLGRYSLPLAEFFEVLVAKGVADHFGVPTNATAALVQSKFVQNSREEDRAKLAVRQIGAHLVDLRKAPRGIAWIGGERSAEGIAADIRVDCEAGGAISYQLKSVGSGTGTVRNPGLPVAAQRLNIDLAEVAQDALRAVSTAAVDAGFAVQSADTFGGLARFRGAIAPGRRVKLDALAKVAYEPFKTAITQALVDAFNRATVTTRAKFALDALGVVPDGVVFLVIADIRGVRILSTERLIEVLRREPLRADVFRTGNSFVISGGGVPYLRVSSSATNHQGLSNPCVRFFYLSGAEKLLSEFEIPA